MNPVDSANVIPIEIAYQLCAEIRQQVQGKWYALAGLQCWGCTTFSKGDLAKMYISNRPDNRGCNLVNARYDRQFGRKRQ